MLTVSIIARTALRESLRTRFWLIYSLLIVTSLGAAIFIGELTLTEPARARIITLAALIRPLLAAQLVLHVAASMTREAQEKGLDMILSAGVPAPVLVAGRLFGYGLIAVGMALGAGFVLLTVGARPQLTIWIIGLACELALIAAFTMASAVVLRQVSSSALAASVFYLFGHSLSSILLLAHHSLANHTVQLPSFIQSPVELVAWLMPRLDLFGSADWLAGLRSAQLAPVFIQTAIYLLLLFAIATLDLKRNRDPA
jgi:hypothetical protein